MSICLIYMLIEVRLLVDTYPVSVICGLVYVESLKIGHASFAKSSLGEGKTCPETGANAVFEALRRS